MFCNWRKQLQIAWHSPVQMLVNIARFTPRNAIDQLGFCCCYCVVVVKEDNNIGGVT